MGSLKLVKLFVVVLLMQPYIINGQGITKCAVGQDKCSCETNQGKIQLRSGTSPYTAQDTRFYYYVYLWDPCVDFTNGTATAGGIQIDTRVFYTQLAIGYHRLASSSASMGYAVFTMKTDDWAARTTNVRCICGSGDTFIFDAELPGYIYNFNFTSNQCCSSEPEGISAGTILIIVFISILFAYLLFGTLFQVFVRKAKGVEIIPNLNLWLTLPNLMKDGTLFLFGLCRRSGYTKT